MRKFLLFLLILALGLFLGVPGAVGFGLESRGPTLIQNLDASLGQYEIRAGAIERGWFSSRVELDVRRSDGRPIFTYPLALRHGLWAGRLAWLAGDGPLSAPDSEQLGHLAWALRLDTGLDATLTLEEPAGASGEAQLTMAAGYRKGRLVVPNWDAPNMAGLTGTLDFDAATGLATVDTAIDEVRAPTFSSQGVALDGDFAWTAPWLDADLSYRAASHRVGPFEEAFEPFSLQLNLTHLDQRVLGQALRLRDSASLLALLPALLEGQPRVEKLRADTAHPLGAFESELSVFLTEPPPAGFMTNIDALMRVVDGSGYHRVDPPLLRALLDSQLQLQGVPADERPYRVDATVAQMQESGFLRPIPEGKLGGEYELRNGELKFNGQLNRRWQTGVQPASP